MNAAEQAAGADGAPSLASSARRSAAHPQGVGRTIEIGKAESLDFITESTLVGCDLHILRGGRSVNLFGCTFDRSTFRARRELKNVRFTGMTLRGCTFLGRYVGCGFGNVSVHGSDSVFPYRARSEPP
jgi:uncharacterized protein YjbI with pentapeptide repeats